MIRKDKGSHQAGGIRGRSSILYKAKKHFNGNASARNYRRWREMKLAKCFNFNWIFKVFIGKIQALMSKLSDYCFGRVPASPLLSSYHTPTYVLCPGFRLCVPPDACASTYNRTQAQLLFKSLPSRRLLGSIIIPT